MLPTCSLPPTTTGSSNSNISSCNPHSYPPQPHHNHMALRESLGSHENFDLDHHVRHKPLKRRGLSKFYHSKSRSFSSLELACASVYGESARGLAKRQNSGELTMGRAALAAGGTQGVPASDAAAPAGRGGGGGRWQAGPRSQTSPLAPRGSRQSEQALPSRRQAHGSRNSPLCHREPSSANEAGHCLSSDIAPLSDNLPCATSTKPTVPSLGFTSQQTPSSPAPVSLGTDCGCEEAGMEACTLSTSAPSTSGFLEPCLRYSTEELCAALRGTSLAYSGGQQGQPGKAQAAAACSNSSSSGFAATGSVSATTGRSSSCRGSSGGGSTTGPWVAQARPFGTVLHSQQQQQQRQQQQQQQLSVEVGEVQPSRSTAVPSSTSSSAAASAAAAAAYALLQSSVHRSHHPMGTSSTSGVQSSIALQSAPISSLDAPQTRAMVGKVASFAASSGVRGSALPRVSEEQPPPPPCNTSRSSSAGEEPTRILPSCPDETSSTWNTAEDSNALNSMEGEEGTPLGAKTGEELVPTWNPCAAHVLEPRTEEELDPMSLGVRTYGVRTDGGVRTGGEVVHHFRTDEELDPMSLSVASLADEARCLSPQPLLQHADLLQCPDAGACGMVMCGSQCSMQLDDNADDEQQQQQQQQQQASEEEREHAHYLHSLQHCQHQHHQQQAQLLQQHQQAHRQQQQQQQEFMLLASLHPG